METMADAEPAKAKPRPIIRLGLFLISHSFIVSVACCAAGVFALLLLPVLAKNTYISENALMPGSASPMMSNDDVSRARMFVNKVVSFDFKTDRSSIGIQDLVAQHITDLGGEVNFHKFLPQVNKFNPLHFFSSPDQGIAQENYTCSSYGINTVGFIRAPRGDGKEAIVLVTPYNSVKTSMGEALSLGIAYSIFSLLTRVTWLAKDIIWLAADSQHGEYAAVAAWLREYHTPSFDSSGRSLFESNASPTTGRKRPNDFLRAGTMAAALVIKVTDGSEKAERDVLNLYAEASNGQMPNLDLINVVNYLAVNGQRLRVKVEKLESLLDSWWLRSLAELFHKLGTVARSLNPQWNFGISVAEYIEGTATLASSLYNQALGVPTGPHGVFRDYQVDAITMEISAKRVANYKNRPNELLLQGGRLVEGVIRSVNNLLEKFHQSFFLYLLTSPNKFVSVGVYMIPFALLVAPLPMVAASLFADSTRRISGMETKVTSSPASSDIPAISFRSWRWLHAAKTVFIVHFWGAVVTLLPHFLSLVQDSPPLTNLLSWIILSAFILLILQAILGSSFSLLHMNRTQGMEWTLLKSVTIAAACTGLCIMSVINFATAELGALMLVPMCLMARPLILDAKAKTLKSFIRAACNVVLIFLVFPPVAYYLWKGALVGLDNARVGDFWNWVESLWTWNSATYIYMCMVHLPCWVLCVHTLVYPC
ncbi:hypothetical protein AABB24_003140 [Solanum stoloniferum]|uniref:Glycosylphosphatidylinositol anchor attachment 1 protein n=1 Tax=Solanum stoloniferum TaxID=62892 RepID=A0ABD2V6U5_9SOLN